MPQPSILSISSFWDILYLCSTVSDSAGVSWLANNQDCQVAKFSPQLHLKPHKRAEISYPPTISRKGRHIFLLFPLPLCGETRSLWCAHISNLQILSILLITLYPLPIFTIYLTIKMVLYHLYLHFTFVCLFVNVLNLLLNDLL